MTPAPSEKGSSDFIPPFDWFLKQERFMGATQTALENLDKEMDNVNDKVDELSRRRPSADVEEKKQQEDAKQWKTMFFRLLASVVASIIVMFTLATFLLKNIVTRSVESELKSQLKVEHVEQDSSEN